MKFTTSSTLFLHSILLLNFAPIFAQNVSEKKDTVTKEWKKTLFLREENKLEATGWLLDVMICVDKLKTKE
jgi:hypothetical protein